MTFDFSALLVPPYLDLLVHGVELTLILAVASWILAVALGTILATVRMTGNPVAERGVSAWVAYHRNVPMLAHLFLWYFGIPTLLPDAAQSWLNANHGEVILSSLAIGLCMSAYFSEDLRSGLRSVTLGQHEAARSLGLGFVGSMRYVVMPQAFRTSLPPFINHTVILFKNTSLAMAIGVAEMTYAVQEIENNTFRTFEAYSLATIFYLVVSLALMALGAGLQRVSRLPAR